MCESLRPRCRTLISTQKEVGDYVKKATNHEAWLTDFNVARNYSSPYRVEQVMEDWAMTHSEVIKLARKASEALKGTRFTKTCAKFEDILCLA